MPARVNDKLLQDAAEALCKCADSLTNDSGLRLHSLMDPHKARSAILGALVSVLGYPNCILPTGWYEVNHFGGGVEERVVNGS